VNKAEQVFNVAVPSADEAAKVLYPCEEFPHLPVVSATVEQHAPSWLRLRSRRLGAIITVPYPS
jgi:hypothetical protein